jgi:hypothetical protein
MSVNEFSPTTTTPAEDVMAVFGRGRLASDLDLIAGVGRHLVDRVDPEQLPHLRAHLSTQLTALETRRAERVQQLADELDRLTTAFKRDVAELDINAEGLRAAIDAIPASSPTSTTPS